MKISIPELALVVLIGPSGCGKSTFARRHFKPTEVLSSDHCRGLVSDDENAQDATKDAFEVLHFIAAKRLAAGRLTVVDATNVQPEARKPLVELARRFHVLPVAIVLDMPERLCQERNRDRPDRNFGRHVIAQQRSQLRRSMKALKREGFRHIHVLRTPEEVEAATFERQPLWNNKKGESGPFDIIGDVHGCCDELEELLAHLGYEHSEGHYRHPQGRKAVFLGDLVDRGPRVLDALDLVMKMVAGGAAYCVPGNHDMKLVRKLRGKNVLVRHGLERTLAEFEALAPEERKTREEAVASFLDGLVSHYVFDGGKLVVAHAGMKAEMQGRGSGKVRDFALYGETTGETDEFGLPVRYNWAAEYRGGAMVVYGHTPVPEAEWLNRTINIDMGCVFGGKLTALRYPEKELVSVPARQVYCEPVKPLRAAASALSAQQEHDDVLDMEDVSGKRIVSTHLRPNITIREENAIAALEVMSRFAIDPKWLIYLPPTMSPCETSRRAEFLEYPTEAFDHYRREGVARVICEEKHMGSRAVVIVCRSEAAAHSRFGVMGEGAGIVYTRTGRRFFEDRDLEGKLLDRVRRALEASGLFDELNTDWVCLDAELMPWSAKAQELLRQQYAAVGSAAKAGLSATLTALSQASTDGNSSPEIQELRERYQQKLAMAERYVEAYRHYCWPVNSLDDLKLAPFHLLASEGVVHTDKDHAWHMKTLARLCSAGDGLLLATPCKEVDLADEASVAEATRWWEELTGRGGEGMVVKPLDFIARGRHGLAQPAVKCRGPEYLRIIYGPEYSAPGNLERLRARGLSRKQSLAIREFALGVEALERFVRRDPLRRVHECVFGVLALESEPVDPRL